MNYTITTGNEFTITSLEQLNDFAGGVLDFLNMRPAQSGATVLALSGDLGSGKTTFSQLLARRLGITEHITSPTFVIEKKYSIQNSLSSENHKKYDIAHTPKNGHGMFLIHIDAYRLVHPEELLTLGFADQCANSKNIILIEWPERVKGILPLDVIELNFTFIDEKTRLIRVVST